MTLGTININSCVPNYPSSRKNGLVIIELVADKILLHIVKKHHCHLFTMYSHFNNLFTVTSNNNTMYSKNRIGNRNTLYKLPIIVFQTNLISLIESAEFRETSIVWLGMPHIQIHLCWQEHCF